MPDEPAACDPLKWEPENFAPEPLKTIVKEAVTQILNPAWSVPTGSDILNMSLSGHMGVFSVLHTCIYRGLLKTAAALRSEAYMQFPQLDLVGAARATLYLQNSGRLLDWYTKRAGESSNRYEAMGVTMAATLTESIATICIIRYLAGIMIPMTWTLAREEGPRKMLWYSIHRFIEHTINGLMTQSESRLGNVSALGPLATDY